MWQNVCKLDSHLYPFVNISGDPNQVTGVSGHQGTGCKQDTHSALSLSPWLLITGCDSLLAP